MDKLDKKIKSIMNSSNFQESDKFHSTVTQTLEKLPNKKQHKLKNFKIALATACCSLILVTGIVFAKEIKQYIHKQFNYFGTDDGIDVAIENGYVAEPEALVTQEIPLIQDGKTVDTQNLDISVESFVMTDESLNLELHFEFDNNINNYVDLGKEINGFVNYEGSHAIELADLFIIDENNNVIFNQYRNYQNNKLFVDYCNNNNISIEDIPFINNGYYQALAREYFFNENTLGVDYVINMGSTPGLPKSKELHIYFSEIRLIPDSTNPNGKEASMHGNWEYHLEIPDIMSNRTSGSYKVINCSHPDFTVYETELTETKFKIGIEVQNITEPVYPEALSKHEEVIRQANNGKLSWRYGSREDIVRFYDSEEYADMHINYRNEYELFGDTINLWFPWQEPREACYVINENDEKFRLKQTEPNPFKENNIYIYTAECDMTKYNATDKITLSLPFKDEVVTIELEKVEN